VSTGFGNFTALAVFCQYESNKHTGKETHMDTLTNKLAALAGAVFMNTLVMSAVGYCFALQSNTYVTAVAFAKAVVTQQGLG
jgi:hypothetical protein